MSRKVLLVSLLKAGAYSQNKTGDGEDFDQVTFYALENAHES